MGDLEQRVAAEIRRHIEREGLLPIVNLARAIIPMVLEEAAKACESHMADCLEDKDVQRRWSEIRARNAVYATAIRAIQEQCNGR